MKIKKFFGKRFILALIFLVNSTLFANFESDTFSKIFKEYTLKGNDIISNFIDSIYFGGIILYRGISFKISQIFGYILLFFMIINILQIILKNIGQIDIYGIFKMIIPTFVINLFISFMLVTPVHYSLKFGFGKNQFYKNKIFSGTFLTYFVESIFSMFYKFGILFFGDTSFLNTTPGKISKIFLTKPFEILKDILQKMTLSGIFEMIIKIMILIFCMWIISRILSKFVGNIFTALILSSVSTIYIIFLTLDSTKKIGFEGIKLIIKQAVTLFISVAIMGIIYQILNTISISSSIDGIAAFSVIILVLQKIMWNISNVVNSILDGAGIGKEKESRKEKEENLKFNEKDKKNEKNKDLEIKVKNKNNLSKKN